jgi:hypothetical protein
MGDQGGRQVILRAAKSTEDIRGSIPGQLEGGRHFAVSNGLEVIAEYSEADVSAYKGVRGPLNSPPPSNTSSASARRSAQGPEAASWIEPMIAAPPRNFASKGPRSDGAVKASRKALREDKIWTKLLGPIPLN